MNERAVAVLEQVGAVIRTAPDDVLERLLSGALIVDLVSAEQAGREERMRELMRKGFHASRHAYDVGLRRRLAAWTEAEYLELCELLGVEPPRGCMRPAASAPQSGDLAAHAAKRKGRRRREAYLYLTRPARVERWRRVKERWGAEKREAARLRRNAARRARYARQTGRDLEIPRGPGG